MLRNILIFAFCFVATAHASGKITILNAPKSLSFKGNEALDSQFVGDVLLASSGSAISGDAQWTGLVINDPFNLAQGVIALYVDGAEQISTTSTAKSYVLEGNDVDESLNIVSEELESKNEPICDINFKQFEEAIAEYKSCFGESVDSLPIKETKNLNSVLHTADKQFLQSVALISNAAKNLDNMQKESNFLIFRLSLVDVAKAHGEKSEALTEAKKILSSVVAELNAAAQKSSENSALVVLVANANKSVPRSKREAVAPSPTNEYNLAEYYDETYPAIFNIVLWFMVVFGLSLLAICYAIGSMDPGRDSIIYRMTSTRMKKDN